MVRPFDELRDRKLTNRGSTLRPFDRLRDRRLRDRGPFDPSTGSGTVGAGDALNCLVD